MDKSSIKLTPAWAILLLLFLGTFQTALSQCGYNNCTNFHKACNSDADVGSCICVPFGGKTGACIYRGLIREDLSFCVSHSECLQKGTGNFCIKSAGSELGWCLTRGDQSAGAIRLPA